MGVRPRIAVLLGDHAGVGPEMGVKLRADAANLGAADVLLVAPDSVLAGGERFAKVKLDTIRISSGDALCLVRAGAGSPARARVVCHDAGA